MERNTDVSGKYWDCCYYSISTSTPRAQTEHSFYLQRAHVLNLSSAQKQGPWRAVNKRVKDKIWKGRNGKQEPGWEEGTVAFRSSRYCSVRLGQALVTGRCFVVASCWGRGAIPEAGPLLPLPVTFLPGKEAPVFHITWNSWCVVTSDLIPQINEKQPSLLSCFTQKSEKKTLSWISPDPALTENAESSI